MSEIGFTAMGVPEATAIRPGAPFPATSHRSRGATRALDTAQLLDRWRRQQREEIEAAVDWATNKVWAEWFRMERCKRIQSGVSGRSPRRCHDCPALMR